MLQPDISVKIVQSGGQSWYLQSICAVIDLLRHAKIANRLKIRHQNTADHMTFDTA
jgi:hypothetical protein